MSRGGKGPCFFAILDGFSDVCRPFFGLESLDSAVHCLLHEKTDPPKVWDDLSLTVVPGVAAWGFFFLETFERVYFKPSKQHPALETPGRCSWGFSFLSESVFEQWPPRRRTSSSRCTTTRSDSQMLNNQVMSWQEANSCFGELFFGNKPFFGRFSPFFHGLNGVLWQSLGFGFLWCDP